MDDVIVVGAGPVGLMLAAELHLAGASPVVLERLAEPAPQRKSRGVGPLAFEALARRGLGAKVAAQLPERTAEKSRDHGTEKNHFAWIQKIDPSLQDEPERRNVLIWQPDLEDILGAFVAELGIPVLRDQTVVALEQEGDGVLLTVDAASGTSTRRAGYVVGCDGGRSTIRGLSGFDFPGTPPLMMARQAAVTMVDPEKLPAPGRTPAGMLIHGPGVVGAFDFTPGQDDLRGSMTLGDLQESVRRVSGTDVTITAMSDPVRFSDHARLVTTYRIGRVLLAGDAAHVHSPNGGQGLNLGLMDAVNLGWKLAAVITGAATTELLDTYTTERHPVAAAVLANTRAQSALMAPGPHVDALRDIVSDLMDLPAVNSYFGRMLGALDTRYSIRYAPPTAHRLTGSHCPDVALTTTTDGRTSTSHLSEHTHGGGWLLLAPSNDPAIAAAIGWRPRLDVIEVNTIHLENLKAALIRPDGVVAWACPSTKASDTELLQNALRTWLGAPSSALPV